MEYLENCPLCGKKLQLQQINFTTAIFICMDVKCPYPVHGNCIVVKRKIENINKTVDLLESYKKSEKVESATNVSETMYNDFIEGSLMLDLDELINAQNDYHCTVEKKIDVPLQEPAQTNFNYETEFPNSQVHSTELLDLDDFLVDLLR